MNHVYNVAPVCSFFVWVGGPVLLAVCQVALIFICSLRWKWMCLQVHRHTCSPTSRRWFKPAIWHQLQIDVRRQVTANMTNQRKALDCFCCQINQGRVLGMGGILKLCTGVLHVSLSVVSVGERTQIYSINGSTSDLAFFKPNLQPPTRFSDMTTSWWEN